MNKQEYLSKIYNLLKTRVFCECAIKEKEMYDAYCLRIIETIENWEE